MFKQSTGNQGKKNKKNATANLSYNIAVITLNVNSLNTPIKSWEWIKTHDPGWPKMAA